jgi:hypothetical protein
MSEDNNPFLNLSPEDNNPFLNITPIAEEDNTKIPSTFSKERFTDKKKFIGESEFLKDYELIPDSELDFVDRFIFKTLGGNEEVYRQKKSDFGENFMQALLSRDTAGMIGALGGYEGVRIMAMNAMKTVFKKNPYVATMYAIGGGTLGATGMEQLYDVVRSAITGEERTLEEVYKKLPADIKRNLTFEAFGVGFASIPLLIKGGLMKTSEAGRQLKDLADKFGVKFAPIDVASPFAKAFLRVGGVFPLVAGPVKRYTQERGRQLKGIFDDIFYSFRPMESSQSKIGENIVKLATDQYLNFRKIVGKQYNKFLDLSIGLKDGKKIADFDINIAPLMSGNPNKPYLLDVARRIISDAQGGGKGQLSPNHPNYDEAYKNALYIVDTFGNNKTLDVKTLYNFIQTNIKKAIKRSYSQEGGASVGDLIEMKNAIRLSFENLDLSKVPADLADEILAQFKIANNMYKNGFEEGGKFFEGIKLYERSFGDKFEKVKANLFDNKLTEEGKKYYGDFVKDIIKFSDPQGVKDLYNLIGQDDKAFAAFIGTYLDEAFKATGKRRKIKNEFEATYNFLGFDPDDFIRKLGFRDVDSFNQGASIGGREEGFLTALDILNRNNKNFISGKDFRQFLNLMSLQGNIVVPDVSQFVQRGAVFGGISSIIGTYLGFLSVGTVGMAGGLGLAPTLSARGLSKALANPKNTDILFDALNTKLSYYKRYSAGIRLLDIVNDQIQSSIQEATGEAKDNLIKFKDNFQIFYDNIIQNKPKEGDQEPFIEFEDTEATIDDARVSDEQGFDIDSINIPRPDENFDLASIISSIPDPSATMPDTSIATVSPETIQKLEGVGLPLFGNKGGIASLVNTSKPKQMVA